MKKWKTGRRILGIALAVCMMLTVCPQISDGINGSGHADAAVQKGTAAAMKATAESCKGKSKSSLNLSGEWCARFAYYCAKQSGNKNIVGSNIYVGPQAEQTVKAGGTITFVNKSAYNAEKARFKKWSGRCKYNASYKPKAGDLYIQRTVEKGTVYNFGHVGIVRSGSVSKTKSGINITAHTVEGNTTCSCGKHKNFNNVEYKTRVKSQLPSNYAMIAFVTPKYKTQTSAASTVSHQISYSLNGGSGTFNSQTVKDGGKITLPSARPTKAGYNFKGWYVKRSDNTWFALSAGWTSWDTITKKKYTPKTYAAGTSYTLDSSWTKGKANGNYTFYAQWDKIPAITLKFHPNGGSGSMPQQTVKINNGSASFATLNKFRKDGCTLNGWKVQKLHAGSEYWIVADGSGWKWKKDAAVSERKLYRYTDAFTFRNGSFADGDTVVVWASWKGAETGRQTIEDGDYHIVSAVDTRYGLDVAGGSDRSGANVQVCQNTSDDAQTFNVTYLGDGYYSIISNIADKSLDVAGAGVANKTNVQVWDQNGADAQKWIIKDMGNGNYSIFSKCGGLCVDLTGAKAADGTNVHMYQDDGSLEQKWRFVKVETEADPDVDDNEQNGNNTDQDENNTGSYDQDQNENENENGDHNSDQGENAGTEQNTELNNEQNNEQPNTPENQGGEGQENNNNGTTDSNNNNNDEPVLPAEEDEPVYVWSDWSDYSTEPVEADENCEVETKTEYRYRDKQTVRSGRDTLSGYTKESTSASSPSYGVWGANQQTASTNITDAKKTVVTVEAKSVYRAYAYYCKCKKVCWHTKSATCKYCGGKTNYGKLTIYSEKPVTNYKKDTDGSYFLPTTVKVASSFGKLGQVYCIGWRGDKVSSFKTGSTVGNKNTFVWPDGKATVYRTKTVDYVNTFSKWGGWSAWNTAQYSASGTRQVECRTLYRYRVLTFE